MKKMERSTFSGNDREFGVTVLAGTRRVFQKMLSNSRIMDDDLRSAIFLTSTGKIRAILGRMMVSDQPGNMLLNTFLQTLECTSYVPTIAVAHKLINNIILVMGSKTYILVAGRRGLVVKTIRVSTAK